MAIASLNLVGFENADEGLKAAGGSRRRQISHFHSCAYRTCCCVALASRSSLSSVARDGCPKLLCARRTCRRISSGMLWISRRSAGLCGSSSRCGTGGTGSGGGGTASPAGGSQGNGSGLGGGGASVGTARVRISSMSSSSPYVSSTGGSCCASIGAGSSTSGSINGSSRGWSVLGGSDSSVGGSCGSIGTGCGSGGAPSWYSCDGWLLALSLYLVLLGG